MCKGDFAAHPMLTMRWPVRLGDEFRKSPELAKLEIMDKAKAAYSAKQSELPCDIDTVSTWLLRVSGTVQGVGFRPFIWRLAHERGLAGSVANNSSGVCISLNTSAKEIENFLLAIEKTHPPLARIEGIEVTRIASPPLDFEGFAILASEAGELRTGVAQDAATCADCLQETFDAENRRYLYPFTNCTNCGPRLSIIKRIPYDRQNTSMDAFVLCDECQGEYEDPSDRRFHAQPNACAKCGPQLELFDCNSGAYLPKTAEEALEFATESIVSGQIVAVKGPGGFQLICDATNDNTVQRLRERKQRWGKPFALMAKDLETVSCYAELNDIERESLVSHKRPIVLLKRARADSSTSITDIAELSPWISPGLDSNGFMLPSTALHSILLDKIGSPVVCSSGNLAEEPQCKTNSEAIERLSSIADYLLLHNREIVNRVDDSVLRVFSAKPRIMRRARGMAPEPIPVPGGFEKNLQVLAMGAELKNTFCLIKKGEAILSQHIGDLKDARTYADYRHSIGLFENLYDLKAEQVAVDMHPDYLSTRQGKSLAQERGFEPVLVQHHHAHLAACLAENAIALDAGPVMGIILDGLGYAKEGLWGAEFMLADYRRFKRLGSFKNLALIGGTKAMLEPWRNLYAQIQSSMGWKEFKKNFGRLALCESLQTKPLHILDSMLQTRTNTPEASSCGRLFDAFAAALGIHFDSISYEGQAAMELEAIVSAAELKATDANAYEFAVYFESQAESKTPIFRVDTSSIWTAVFEDLEKATDKSLMSARFHKGLAKAILKMLEKIKESARHNTGWLQEWAFAERPRVALSGGVFQNRILFELLEQNLQAAGYEPLSHSSVPANDGGISLGQALIACAHAQS